MVELDPWSLSEESKITEESSSENVQGKLEFEDNFVIRSHSRLPDSTEYLAILGKVLLTTDGVIVISGDTYINGVM